MDQSKVFSDVVMEVLLSGNPYEYAREKYGCTTESLFDMTATEVAELCATIEIKNYYK